MWLSVISIRLKNYIIIIFELFPSVKHTGTDYFPLPLSMLEYFSIPPSSFKETPATRLKFLWLLALISSFLSYRGLSVMDPGAGSKRPCLRLANGRVNSGDVSSEPLPTTVTPAPALCRHDSIKISIDNTNTCTDSVVTALGDPVSDYITPEINFKKVSFKFYFES